MNEKITNEALAIRKLREIRGFNRKQAGILLEKSHKTIECFENGRGEVRGPLWLHMG